MFLKYCNFNCDPNKLIAIDTETFLINEATTWPTVVCLTGYSPGLAQPLLCIGEDIKRVMEWLIEQGYTFVLQNAKFDMGVFWNNGVLTAEQIFSLYDTGRIIDTVSNEKLLNLAEYGGTNTLVVDGFVKNLKLSLGELVKSYLGMDITEDKKGPDSWRTRYCELYGKPLSEWPEEAISYPLADAKLTYQVFEKQLERRVRLVTNLGLDVLQISPLKSAVDFALGCLTERGNVLDQTMLPEVLKGLEAELAPEKFSLLYDMGLLTPASPGEPYKDGRKEHREDCVLNPLHPGFVKKDKGSVCDCPTKLKNPTEEKKNTNAIKDFVLQLASQYPDITLQYTDKGNLQVNAEFFEQYSHYHPALSMLQDRDSAKKLKSTYIDHLYYDEKDINAGQPVCIIRGNYNNLVDTGRTSCSASRLYPSWNSQNIPNFVRPVIIPRPGHVLCSIDFSAMELGTLAQTCINKFGYSRMAELINAGIDTHAYLGAQIAYHTDNWFAQFVAAFHQTNRSISLHDNTYTMLKRLAKEDDPCPSTQFIEMWKSRGHESVPSCADFYKHYRTLAKPTGLGYPGGLGANTFITYARTTYGVTITLDEAKELKQIWLNTYPEMNQYREFIEEKSSDPAGLFQYTIETPNGVLHRAKASYCACSNGLGLQSPSAVGATLALWHVVRASYDPAMKSCLYLKNFPTMFVHDEIISELVDEGPENNTFRVEAAQELMKKSMEAVTPDVKAGTEACLMTRWNKTAKSLKDANGKLLVWGRDDVK